MNFIEELRWRGMIHDLMPGTEEQLSREMTAAYIGFDPTADSLHIGNLLPIMLLVHFQRCGHKPIVLVGGATGMVGDPSGKAEERKLLGAEQISYNLNCQKKQLMKFLNFQTGDNKAEIVNNFDWFRDYSFLDFIRDVGKHITVNYMMSKESVKKRLESGMSFTEFSYQLVQGYDFYWLYRNMNCKLQMGGSDQWGNIVTGTELIRRMYFDLEGTEAAAYALTCPLVTRADGSKFGKSESGNIWLDPAKTSPYLFYQYWLNLSDEDAGHFIRLFTLFSREEIDQLTKEHQKTPHLRILQKALARDVTVRVHSEEDYDMVVEASAILFGQGTTDMLRHLSEEMLLAVFEGVPQSEIDPQVIMNGIGIVDFLTEQTGIFSSKGEARRTLKENAVSVNREKVTEESMIDSRCLLNGRYILIQKGKKNYYLVKTISK